MAKIKPVTHKIRSFDDLMKVVTEDNCDMLMGNFWGVVKYFIEMKKNNPEFIMTGFDWIDDGKMEILPMTKKNFKIAIQDSKEVEERSRGLVEALEMAMKSLATYGSHPLIESTATAALNTYNNSKTK